jgi:hypothetical protein
MALILSSVREVVFQKRAHQVGAELHLELQTTHTPSP